MNVIDAQKAIGEILNRLTHEQGCVVDGIEIHEVVIVSRTDGSSEPAKRVKIKVSKTDGIDTSIPV